MMGRGVDGDGWRLLHLPVDVLAVDRATEEHDLCVWKALVCVCARACVTVCHSVCGVRVCVFACVRACG